MGWDAGPWRVRGFRMSYLRNDLPITFRFQTEIIPTKQKKLKQHIKLQFMRGLSSHRGSWESEGEDLRREGVKGDVGKKRFEAAVSGDLLSQLPPSALERTGQTALRSHCWTDVSFGASAGHLGLTEVFYFGTGYKERPQPFSSDFSVSQKTCFTL